MENHDDGRLSCAVRQLHHRRLWVRLHITVTEAHVRFTQNATASDWRMCNGCRLVKVPEGGGSDDWGNDELLIQQLMCLMEAVHVRCVCVWRCWAVAVVSVQRASVWRRHMWASVCAWIIARCCWLCCFLSLNRWSRDPRTHWSQSNTHAG